MGLAFGNRIRDRWFEAVLPNGATCVDHGIPDFSHEADDVPVLPGLAEMDGVLYLVGGQDASWTDQGESQIKNPPQQETTRTEGNS